MCPRWSTWLGIVLAFASVASAASAQSTGTIAGVITDTTGAVLTGVTVEATSLATTQTRTSVTGTDGFYTIPAVRPAAYRVTARLPGFRTSIRDDCAVAVNETFRADFRLELGDVAERLTVTAAASLVETTKATLGIVINASEIVDLPLNGRNFTQLATLMPGVLAPPNALGGQDGNATASGGIGNPTGSFNVNGMRNQSNNFLLDGAWNNDAFNTRITSHRVSPRFGTRTAAAG